MLRDNSVIRYGCDVIRNKFSKKYLCWNSFKSAWYWGEKNNSEKFGLSSKKAEQLLLEIEGSFYEFFWEEGFEKAKNHLTRCGWTEYNDESS